MELALKKLLTGQSLSETEAEATMVKILNGTARDEQIGAFLTTLHFRAPVAEELSGFVKALRSQSESVRCEFSPDELLDVCGTGGDGSGSFNVSTAVAFVVAGAGQKVAKHGNRAVSSRCGSFDVLEALGVPFAMNGDQASEFLHAFGVCFLYAPAFYPVLQRLGPLRKSLGVRTVFNVLGPLLNPLCPSRQLMGVYAENLLSPVAECLNKLEATETLVVRGEDGTDEISLSGLTHMRHLKNGQVQALKIRPEELKISSQPVSAISGGDVATNAELLLSVLKGTPGAYRDVTLLNAAAALMVGGKASSLSEGLGLAQESLDSGKALSVLSSIRENSVARYA
jgi:anthranilate phosphoribosyltransferase